MSCIDDNTPAKETMDKIFGSLGNRIRAIYNYGYKAGYADGIEDAKKEIVNYFKDNSDYLLIFNGAKKEEE